MRFLTALLVAYGYGEIQMILLPSPATKQFLREGTEITEESF